MSALFVPEAAVRFLLLLHDEAHGCKAVSDSILLTLVRAGYDYDLYILKLMFIL